MQDWVKNDLVGKGAVSRHLFRSMIPFLPIFVGFLVLFPGALWLRGSMVLLSVLLAMFYTVAFMDLNSIQAKSRLGLLPVDTADIGKDHVPVKMKLSQAAWV